MDMDNGYRISLRHNSIIISPNRDHTRGIPFSSDIGVGGKGFHVYSRWLYDIENAPTNGDFTLCSIKFKSSVWSLDTAEAWALSHIIYLYHKASRIPSHLEPISSNDSDLKWLICRRPEYTKQPHAA